MPVNTSLELIMKQFNSRRKTTEFGEKTNHYHESHNYVNYNCSKKNIMILKSHRNFMIL